MQRSLPLNSRVDTAADVALEWSALYTAKGRPFQKWVAPAKSIGLDAMYLDFGSAILTLRNCGGRKWSLAQI
jgi:hypothetical protein